MLAILLIGVLLLIQQRPHQSEVQVGLGHIAVESDSATQLPLKIIGIASQNTDLLAVQTSAKANLFKVDKNGKMWAASSFTMSSTVSGNDLGGSSVNAGTSNVDADRFQNTRSVFTVTSDTVPLTVKHASSASVNYITIGSVVSFDKNNKLTLADDVSAVNVDHSSAGVTGTVTSDSMTGDQIFATSDAAGTIPLLIKHAVASPASNYISIIDSSSSNLFKLTSAGNAVLSGTFSATTFSGGFGWTDVTSRPTTLGGYGIGDAMTSAQGTLADNSRQSINYSQLNSRPNSLSGLGINAYMTNTQGTYADTTYLNSESMTKSMYSSYHTSSNLNNYRDCNENYYWYPWAYRNYYENLQYNTGNYGINDNNACN